MGRTFAYGSGSLYRKSRRNRKTGKTEHYGNYLIKYKDSNGVMRCDLLDTQDKSEAELLFAGWLKKRKRDDPAVLAGDRPVDEFFQNYINRRERDEKEFGDIRPQSVQRYRNILRPFLEFFGPGGKYPNLTLRMLETKHLNEYLKERLSQTRFNGRSRVPINKKGLRREWRFIGGLLRGAFRDRILLADITKDVAKLKIAPEVKELPTRDQIVEVRDLIREQAVRDFITVDMLMGGRFNELAHLQFKNIDFEKGAMGIIPDMDGNNPLKTEESVRVIDTPREAEAVFRRIREERRNEPDEAYVFVNEDGRPFHEYPNLVYRRLTKALRQANRTRKADGRKAIPYFTVHTLRHWFITWALTRRENPLTEAELIKIVGHADFAMIRRVYLHRTTESDTVRKMRETTLFADERGDGHKEERSA
jgi:integrase